MRPFLLGLRRGWRRTLLLGAIVMGLAWLLFRDSGARRADLASSSSALAQAVQTPNDRADGELVKAEGLSQAFRAAARKALPAVVVIKSGDSPVCPQCGSRHSPGADRENEAEGPDGGPGQDRSLSVLGSGFIVDPAGVVLTNRHVVKAGRGLVVQTADGRQFPVKAVKTDRQHDLAVLRIEPKGPLASVRLGDSETAEIGDWVLTIGCPLELEQTVSAGIVSAKNRSFCPTHPAKYLQTDAVVNPGSSGGPLVNLKGEVIGITTAIASEDGGYQGIGFAIPANHAAGLLKQSAAPEKPR